MTWHSWPIMCEPAGLTRKETLGAVEHEGGLRASQLWAERPLVCLPALSAGKEVRKGREGKIETRSVNGALMLGIGYDPIKFGGAAVTR